MFVPTIQVPLLTARADFAAFAAESRNYIGAVATTPQLQRAIKFEVPVNTWPLFTTVHEVGTPFNHAVIANHPGGQQLQDLVEAGTDIFAELTGARKIHVTGEYKAGLQMTPGWHQDSLDQRWFMLATVDNRPDDVEMPTTIFLPTDAPEVTRDFCYKAYQGQVDGRICKTPRNSALLLGTAAPGTDLHALLPGALPHAYPLGGNRFLMRWQIAG